MPIPGTGYVDRIEGHYDGISGEIYFIVYYVVAVNGIPVTKTYTTDPADLASVDGDTAQSLIDAIDAFENP